jgi:MFS family permease
LPVYPLLLLAFAALGGAAGAWQVLLADFARALALTPGPLGVALSIGSIASIPVMYVGGGLADRHGVRPAIAFGAAAMALAFALHAAAGAYVVAVAAFLAYGAGAGVYDVGINAAAARYERESGRHVLAWLHAGFSGGAAAGALAMGAGLAAGLPFRGGYLLVAAAWLAMALLVATAAALPPGGAEGPAAEAPRGTLYRDPTVLALAFMALAAFWGEGAMESWSALYLRQDLGVTAFVGASGVAVFHAAMTTGRLGAGLAMRVVGRRTWMIVAGTLGVIGTALAVGTTIPLVAIAGLLLVGLGLSAVAPLAFSLAAEAAPDRLGQATAVITTIGYAGGLVGPATIGLVAEAVGLRTALGTVALAALVVLLLAFRVPATPPPA